MADENQIKKFRENPELFRLHLLNAFKECTEGIKELMRNNTLGRAGLPEHLQEILIHLLNEDLIRGFNKCGLETSMKKLNELEENASDKTAWRPKTGVVDLSGEKLSALQKRKELLQSKIKQMDTKLEVMKQNITTKRNILKVHIEDLKNCMAKMDKFDE